MVLSRSFFNDFTQMNNSFGMKEENLFVPPHFSDLNVNYDSIAESLAYYYKQKNSKIYFDSKPEGLHIPFIRAMNEISKKLVYDYNIPLEQICYLSGALPVKENINAYQSYVSRENLLPIKIKITNHWELLCKSFTPPPRLKNTKVKKFISMNGAPRIFRIYCAMLLAEKNLLKDSYYSLNLTADETSYTIIENGKRYLPGFETKIEHLLNNYRDLFPMMLTKNLNNNNSEFILPEDAKLMSEVYFNFVQETNFLDNEDCIEANNIKGTILISEKTWRSVIFRKPFLMLNNPNCLAGFREYGYNTFSPYFDESYDSIENSSDRLTSCVNEVERLCKLSETEWAIINRDTYYKAEQNYEKMMSATPFYIESN